jgi:iron complex outermembrane receptor protein
MTSPVAPRRAPAPTPLALVSALSLCCLASAAQAAEPPLPSVVVTGSRFASDPALTPIGATVITADDIRRAGANDVNQAIRKIGGVYGRQSLDASPDFGLDLRGFGSNSSQNMVVVLDGVRMSENELGGALLSTIPIDTVERIEIIRGGSSVLYGDGATGGVIQIVTKRPTKDGNRGAVRAELGQFGQRDLRASVARTWDGFALDAAIGDQRTDNYRDNNEFKQTTFSGGAQWAYSGGRAGVRIDSARQDARFPGSLSLAQFEANPRQTNTPDNFGSLDYDRLTAFVEQRVGSVDLAAELSHREKTVKATYVGTGYVSKLAYSGEQTQFSPRLRQLTRLDGMLNELVAGIDLIRWNRVTDSDFSKADATQKSKALYVRDEIKWDAAHNGRLAFGVRRELFDKASIDPAPFTTATYRATQAQNAWEAQGSYDVLPLVNLYAKAGQSYRVANADENGYTPNPNVALKGQSSHDLEFGVTVGGSAQQLTARLFRHKLNNEIFFDPTIGYGANTNLDPTKRQGFELEGNARIAADWRISGHFQHVDAKFTEGPNAGREMVLVPKNVLSARLSWVPADGQSADFGAQWVDSQRYGSDFTNGCDARIPAYTTLDARYARKLGAWEVAVSGLNLADKQYYSNAFGCKSGIYPSDGRQLKVSARYDF